MKKVLFKLNDGNIIAFLDILISVETKPLISYSKEGFLDIVVFVWVLMKNDEQIEAFKQAKFDIIKIV
jgi:hypothetical protein